MDRHKMKLKIDDLAEYIANHISAEESGLITRSGRLGTFNELRAEYGAEMLANMADCGLIEILPYCPYVYRSKLGTAVKDKIIEKKEETDIYFRRSNGLQKHQDLQELRELF